MTIPSPGDMLSRRAGLVTHYGTAVHPHQVVDIMPGGPPRVVSPEQFADGNPVSRRRPHPDDVPAILPRARQVGENQSSYNVITFNCEHVKNFILSGKPYSETVIALALVVLVGVGICFLARGRGH